MYGKVAFQKVPFQSQQIQNYTNLYKPIQTYTNLYKCIQTYTNLYKPIQCICLYMFVAFTFLHLHMFVTYTIGIVLVWFSVGGMGRASWARLLGTMYILALKGYLLKGYLSGHWS